MSEVSMIGSGNMGSALVRALLAHGHTVTVWNRSPEKALPLVEKGAVLAPSPAAAAAASPMLLVCVTNYAASYRILDEAVEALAGKLLVQLSTGTPQDARTNETWAHAHSAGYLDCAITGSPDSIGTPGAHILAAGQVAVFHKAEPILRVLASSLDYKGEQVGLAAAWDMVLLMRYYGMFFSLFHSIQICQAEGIPLEQYSTLLGEQGKNYEKWLCDNIRSGNYKETSAPLELWAGGIQNIAQHAQESHLQAEFPRLAARLFQEAMDAGYGREEVSALFKVLEKAA
jgi:3-hydroxyisobutyrate dehydrogenase-like beta-hydroxyacid dehydrogenase